MIKYLHAIYASKIFYFIKTHFRVFFSLRLFYTLSLVFHVGQVAQSV